MNSCTREKHHKSNFCSQNLGIENNYFSIYESLNIHCFAYLRCHFCLFVQCLLRGNGLGQTPTQGCFGKLDPTRVIFRKTQANPLQFLLTWVNFCKAKINFIGCSTTRLTSYLVAIYKVDLKPKAINIERISISKENQSQKIGPTHSYL